MTYFNRRNVRRTAILTLIASAGGALTFATASGAQDRAIPMAAFSAELRTNERQLAGVEQGFARIERARTDAEKDAIAPAFEAEQMAYANNMLAKYNSALAQARLANKSPAARGQLAVLNAFEALARAHEKRLKTLSSRGQRMKPAGATSWRPTALPQYALNQPTWGGTIAGLFIPQAHAAIALRVYNICNGNAQSPACAQAIIAGAQDGVTAKNTWQACWNKYAKTKPAWWRATLRAGCTAVLVARLA